MCHNNLMLKSPVTRSTDNYSLLKHRNFDFAHFLRGGVTVILNLIFRRVGWQKFLILPWKSRGVVERVAHAKSSDPLTPLKFGTCTKGLTVTWFFSHPTLKACNSPYMQYYFKRFFLCILQKLYFHLWWKVKAKSNRNRNCIFHPLGNPKGSHIRSFLLCFTCPP